MLQNEFNVLRGFELFAARMQVQIAVNIRPTPQGTGRRAQWHGLIGKQTQVSQYQVGPALVEGAEEHQAQTITQGPVGQGQQPVFKARAPVAQGLLMGQLKAQPGFPVGLSAFGISNMRREKAQQLCLLQHLEHVCQVDPCLVIHPPLFQQGRRCTGDIPDFCVIELAGAKMRALAHDQPHPQRL